MKKFLKVFFLIILFLAVAFIALVAAMNYHVISEGKKYIKSESELENFNADYVVVFGASVRPGGKLSDMLANRMATGSLIFTKGAGKTLLLSGDSQDTSNYDETGPMKKYAMGEPYDIAEENILVDKYGVSSYDTINRLVNLIKSEGKKPEDVKIVVVTQRYHIYRAIYDARERGIEAYGCVADFPSGKNKLYDEAREVLGRCKDVTFTYLDLDVQYNTKDYSFGG